MVSGNCGVVFVQFCFIDLFDIDSVVVYILLAKIPGVARVSIRNEGTREINYGII
jgi:hypothetical protein